MAIQLRPSVVFVDHTIGWEIFTLKIIHIKNFRGIFLRFVPSAKLRYEREPGIAGCNAVAVRSSRQSGIYFGKCGRVHGSLFVDYRHVNVFICVLNFRGWSQPRNYFNSKILPTYCMFTLSLIFQ